MPKRGTAGPHPRQERGAADLVAERREVAFVADHVVAPPCVRCRAAPQPGAYYVRTADGARCLSCEGLAAHEFLPSGDVALTRRASAASGRAVVVVAWRRSGKRWERRGTLVDPGAIAAAETACAGDAAEREKKRAVAAVRRAKLDAQFVAAFAAVVRARFPSAPEDVAETVARHACELGSGRVGRTARAKELDADAVDLAVRAHIRHTKTKYDALLDGGMAKEDARARVLPIVDDVARAWRRGL